MQTGPLTGNGHIAVEDPGMTSRYYARVLGRPAAPLQRPDLDGAGVSFAIGPHSVELLAPKNADGPLTDWIKSRGQSPYAAVLVGPKCARLRCRAARASTVVDRLRDTVRK